MGHEKDENPGYVSKDFCDERFGRIMDKLNMISSDVTDIKNGVDKSKFSAREKAIIIVGILGVAGSIVTAILPHIMP